MPRPVPLGEVALDALAVYRATVLLQQDTIPPLPAVREHLEHRLGATPWAELLHCPWCLSVWLAGAAVLARRVSPRLWRVLARVLAASAVTGLVAEARDAIQPTSLEPVIAYAADTRE